MRTYGYLTGLGQDPQPSISLVLARLIRVLRPLLQTIDVDEDWYCNQNLDVRAAIANRDWKSAKEHYISAGFFEDRMPHRIAVDDTWYLAEYDDVAQAVKAGKFVTAQQHFEESGFQEGRLAFRDWSLDLREQPDLQAERRPRREKAAIS